MTPEEINELRIFALSSQHFLPVLERRKAAALHGLINRFNAGEEIVRDAAKLCALHELETEVKGKLRTFEQLREET